MPTTPASAHGSPANLLPPTYKRQITSWLEEDCPSFDNGGFVVGAGPATAHLYQKSVGMLAGVPFFDEAFRQLDCQVEWLVREGDTIDPASASASASASTTPTTTLTTSSSSSSAVRKHIATVTGSARSILLAERVALNTLARCSGIATACSTLAGRMRSSAHAAHITLAGTRKTTPGFRLAEKYAMIVGGVDPHRFDLSAMTMLKDNHIAACGGSIGGAVRAARAVGGFAVMVEVECGSWGEAVEAVEAGADVVMLDNFSGEEVRQVSSQLRERFGGRNRNDGMGGRGFLIEVSGGLTAENLGDGYLCEGVDVVSTSSVHQGVPHVDFSLKIVTGEAAAAAAAA